MAFTLEQIQKQANLPIADQKAQAGTKVADTSGFSPVINSTTLTPTTPVVLPSSGKLNTTSAGIIASANQNVADVTAQAVANAKANEQAAGVGNAQKETDSMLESIKGLLKTKATKTQEVMTDSPEAQQKALEMKTLNDLNTETADLTVKLRGEQDAIKARGDITKDAQGVLMDNLNDTYGRRLADLAIRQSAASGNVTRLESSLKDALAVKLAPLEADLEYYKDFGLKNQKNLTDQEKDRLNAIVNEKDKLIAQTKSEQEIMAGALQTASTNGVKIPDAVVKQMQANPSQSYSILASNNIVLQDPLDRQIKQKNLDKLQADINKINAENGLNTPIDVTKISPEGQALLDSVKNLRFNTVEESKRIIGNVTQAVARGDVEGATEQLKDFGYQKLTTGQRTDYDLYSSAESASDSALQQIIDQELKAGPYKALAEKAKPYSSIKNDKAYVDLRSIIELGQAQLRKGFYGTAVTGTEAANGSKFLIGDTDTIDTIRWKLQNNSNFLKFTNDATIARSVGLPKPDINQYLTYRVKNKATGQTGSIPRAEYNTDEYEIIN